MSILDQANSWPQFQRFVEDCETLEASQSRPCMYSPCPTCPFRKDRPVWMDVVSYVFNLMRINERKVQYCHNSNGTVCYGSALLVAGISGGDEVGGCDERIYTEREFRGEIPRNLAVGSAESSRRYDEAHAANSREVGK